MSKKFNVTNLIMEDDIDVRDPEAVENAKTMYLIKSSEDITPDRKIPASMGRTSKMQVTDAVSYLNLS